MTMPLPAEDKPKADPPAPSKLAEQIKELTKDFVKERGDLLKAFGDSKTDEERQEIRAKFKKLQLTLAGQLLKKAEALPKDPAVVEALLLTVQLAQKDDLGKQARERLLAEYADDPRLVGFCRQLGRTPDGEHLLLELEKKGKDEKRPRLVALAEEGLFATRHLVVGKQAPDTESANLDGKTVKLSDHKGKVVVLDFWATWCGPCRGMIPHERELVKTNKGKPFVFISVSADAKKETLKEFLDKEEMPWSHWWSGQGGIVEKWSIGAFPTIYVIDAKGVIRTKIVGGGPKNEQELDDTVTKLVKEAGDKQ